MASSQAKTGWERLRTWKKKKFSFWSIPTQPRIENSKKIAKKLKKLKKHHYGFFSSQNGTGEVENVRKKKLSFRSIQTWLGIGNSKKKAKIFKKLKNINMAFFQAKTGRERLRMWEKKKFSFWSIPTRPGIGNSRKIAKKCKKLKNIIMALFQPRTGWDRLRLREKKKKQLSFRSIQSRPGIGISKKLAKKIKKLKNINMASFQAKTGWDRLRMRENKNHSYQFLSNLEYKIPKK